MEQQFFLSKPPYNPSNFMNPLSTCILELIKHRHMKILL